MKPWFHRLALLALLCLSITEPLAQVPGEVLDFGWCPGSKICLSWSALTNASSYNVYRGTATDLASLLDAGTDSCQTGAYPLPTTGETLVQQLAAGQLHWFLVTGQNGFGEGTPGSGSAGGRQLDSTGPCFAPAGLVINEVDYDQDGTDAGEFVEVFNAGATERSLAGLVLILVNGLNSTEYERVELSQAAATLAAGGYLVVGAPVVLTGLPPATPAVAFGAATNNIQNGAPDGLALFDTGAGELLDALAYEGSITAAQFDGVSGSWNLVEGSPASAVDSSTITGSLVRAPDGTDTGNAAADWSFVESPSPGTANPVP